MIQIAHHLEDIAQIQSKLIAIRETSSRHVRLLEEQVSQKVESLKKLEVKLATQADYDEIKEELRLKSYIFDLPLMASVFIHRVMKLVEFSSSANEQHSAEVIIFWLSLLRFDFTVTFSYCHQSHWRFCC